MKLKDDLNNDLQTFLNADEFAEFANVDGVLIAAQISRHTTEKSERLTEQFDGLHGDFITIYFKAEPYIKKRSRLPKKGELCYVDDVRYGVEFAENQAGICKLILSAYRQNTLREPNFRRY